MKKLNSCDGLYHDSLDVRFTKACDNRCPFCIERNGIDEKGTNVEKMIESTIKSPKKDILILGGEPLLMLDKVYEYVKGIRSHVRNIYITTSLPINIVHDHEKFEAIMDMIDGLNVSLQHYDDDINNDIMRATRPHQRIDVLLKRICENHNHANKVRVSINLVKGAIDNQMSLDMFMRKMESIGVRHVKINELQHEEELYVSFEEIFKDKLKKSNIKLKSPYSHGCQREISLKDYDMKITLKRACFCVNGNLDATLSDMFKAFKKQFIKIEPTQAVLYENGDLASGWMTKEQI